MGKGEGSRPTGTVSFLFTDVEGSTRLWEADPAGMRPSLRLHDEIVSDAITGHGGYVFSTGGDGFAAAFPSVAQAATAAGEAQAALAAAPWPAATGLRVRMGIHTGEVEERGGDYFGTAVNRAARIMAAGHGGQVLLSNVSAQLLGTTSLRELGEHHLKDLQPERLWQLGDAQFPALRTLDRRPHNLRVERTPLVGRAADIDLVAALVRGHRLVSLLGIGGSGKTRLARAVAAVLIDDFPDGVWFVDLVPVASPGALPAAIASAAGLDLAAGQRAQALLGLMVGRRALFVIDNCEHLTDGVAELLDELLEQASGPRFLVTSREPLVLTDEQRFQVDPLDTSGTSSPAVELFLATASRVGTPVGAASLADVVEICRRLDGLPLAIELAAGQVGHLAPAEILERLERRFELLEGGPTRRNRRQASLEGVLQDTWGLLSADQRGLLLDLAAFPSSFDHESVEMVAGPAPARALVGLVDRCVVVRDGAEHTTFRLLETVKFFARDRWSEHGGTDAFLDRHADAFLASSRRWTDDEVYSLDEVMGWHARHMDDLIAADDRFHARGDEPAAAKLWSAGALLWHLGTPANAAVALARIDRCLASGRLDRQTEARVELAAACAAMATRQPDRLRASARRAIDAAREAGCDVVCAFALNALSWMTMLHDLRGALDLLEESEQLARAAGASNVATAALAYRACALALHQMDGALAMIEEAERANGGAGTYAATSLANIRIKTSLFDAPRQTAENLARRVDALAAAGLGPSFQALNYVALTRAATADRLATLEAVLAVEQELRRAGTDDGLPDLLIAPAMLAYVLGEHEPARRWITAIRLAAKPTQSLPITAIYRQLRARLGLAEDQTGLADTSAAYREARAWLSALAGENAPDEAPDGEAS